MKADRMSRVNRLLQTTLAEMIPVLVKDPRVQQVPIIAVTAVRTTPDLRHAKVYLTFTGAAQRDHLRALDGIQHAAGFLRGELGQRVSMRNTPELHFELDDTADRAAHIEQILSELAEERDPGGTGEGGDDEP